VKVQDAKRGGFGENAQPVGGCELFVARGQLQRIRAIDAVQRAAVRDLGNQGEGLGMGDPFTSFCHSVQRWVAVRRKKAGPSLRSG